MPLRCGAGVGHARASRMQAALQGSGSSGLPPCTRVTPCHLTARVAWPCITGAACSRRAPPLQAWSGVNSSTAAPGPFPGEPSTTDSMDSTPPLDPVGATFKSGYDLISASVSFLVAGLSDMVAGLAHPTASRAAIENCVKGALALTGLLLLQSVLSFVLVAGMAVLLLYAATQVFGVRLPIPGVGLGGGDRRYQQGQASWNADPRTGGRQAGYTYQQPPPSTGEPYQGADGWGAPQYGASGPGAGGQYREPGGQGGRGPGGWGQRPLRRGRDADVVDVYYEPLPR